MSEQDGTLKKSYIDPKLIIGLTLFALLASCFVWWLVRYVVTPNAEKKIANITEFCTPPTDASGTHNAHVKLDNGESIKIRAFVGNTDTYRKIDVPEFDFQLEEQTPGRTPLLGGEICQSLANPIRVEYYLPLNNSIVVERKDSRPYYIRTLSN